MQIILRSSATLHHTDTCSNEVGERLNFTLRNLWSKKANQFVSIFSATDSVLQVKKKAHSFVLTRHPTESQSALTILYHITLIRTVISSYKL